MPDIEDIWDDEEDRRGYVREEVPRRSSVQEAAPLPVGYIPLPSGLHPDTADLICDFAVAMAEKLRASEIKYGWDSNWKRLNWRDELTAELLRHVQKGDPRDVAAYCAFAWYHGWSVAPAAAHQPAQRMIIEGVAAQLYWQTGDGWYWSVVNEAVREEWRAEARRRLALPVNDGSRIAGGGELPERSPDGRPFPILYPARPPADAPRSIPWSLVAPHKDRADRNHGQTLERLAERGGLAPCEMLAVLEDRPHRRMHLDDAIRQVRALIEAFELGAASVRAADAERGEAADA